MLGMETVLRRISGLQEAANAADTPIWDAVQVLRKHVPVMEKSVTRFRLAIGYGYDVAAEIAAPVVTMWGLSDEQQKLFQTMQKDRAKLEKKAAAAVAEPRQQMAVSGGTNGGAAMFGTGGARKRPANSYCFACGSQDHWAKDGRCNPADVNAKAMRDAQRQLQFGGQIGQQSQAG